MPSWFRSAEWLGTVFVLLLGLPWGRPLGAQGSLRGTVYDSVSARPLDAAFVQLVWEADAQESRSVMTDANGQFLLTGLKPGGWVATAYHARIDSVGVTRLLQRVLVPSAGTASLELALPSAPTLIGRVCGADTTGRENVGFVHGELSEARGTRAPALGHVLVQWVDVALQVDSAVAYVRVPHTRLAPTDSAGRFVVCGIPAGGAIRVQGQSARDTTGLVELRVPGHGIALANLRVGPSRVIALGGDAAALADTVGAARSSAGTPPPLLSVRGGDGRVDGRIVTASGEPVVSASLSIPGTGLTARTDAQGDFSLRNVPAGTWPLEVRAIGFTPMRRVVDILADAVTEHRSTLERHAALDTVQIRARRALQADPHLRAFEGRRRTGLGRYQGPEEIARILPMRVGDILRTMAGVRTVYQGGRELIRMRDGSGECIPDVWIDGMRMFGGNHDGDIDGFLFAGEVRAVEVYSPMLPVPPQFHAVGNRCGVIAFLTGARS